MTTIVIGTRASALALWQTRWVAEALRLHHGPDLEVREETFSTVGDRRRTEPLPAIGGKGLFTAELEEALVSHRIDLAVHSLKDLPLEQPPGLTLSATPRRAPAQDVLVSSAGRTWATLVAGDRVGTSSPRRAAQLLAHEPRLEIVNLRGNVDTRLARIREGNPPTGVLAAAGMTRLEVRPPDAEDLPVEEVVPAPGQGALGLQVRQGDQRMAALLAPLHHDPTAREVAAERALLGLLGGGCSSPLGAHARHLEAGRLRLVARHFSPDLTLERRGIAEGDDPQDLARQLAGRLRLP
jgi:hydroxymethylbilane synthase